MDETNIKKLIVPKGVRYISQWKNFSLFNFPHILDKQIPGCGFTQWCLINDEDLILCSPRRILLKNKWDQFKDDVLYFQNTYEVDEVGPDKDISGTGNFKSNKKVEIKIQQKEIDEEYYKEKYNEILQYVLGRKRANKPIKILVTYDSFHLVKSILSRINEVLSYRVIVDEFQSIFVDSKFKSSTEMKFIDCLENISKLCFVSATPMMEKYLRLLDIFKDLPYYELDWESDQPGRVMKPKLSVRVSTSVYSSAKRIITPYKEGKFEYKYIKSEDGSVDKIESKEAVIYVNSVNNILSIIKSLDLQPEECNILCADTQDNRNRIKRKLGAKFKIGTIPLKGERHKMFTFCTRTVYLGADFCSTNARTFIISDANIDSLAVDISLDLPQILGRQRLDSNPWKNEAEFYYKPISKTKEITQEEFNNIIRVKYNKTQNLLNIHQKVKGQEAIDLAEKYLSELESKNYKNDYVAINFKDGKLIPTLNRLVMIAEQRAFEIQQYDYADRFHVFNSLGLIIDEENISSEVTEFMEEYESQPTLYNKLKLLCETEFSAGVLDMILLNINEKHFVEYYTVLGPDRLRSLGYNITRINKELGIKTFDKTGMISTILDTFIVGSRILLSDVKRMLKTIYDDNGYKRSPKATDLEDWFIIKEVFIIAQDETGQRKRGKGYEIISRK